MFGHSMLEREKFFSTRFLTYRALCNDSTKDGSLSFKLLAMSSPMGV